MIRAPGRCASPTYRISTGCGQHHAGIERQDEAVGEERGIERGEGLRAAWCRRRRTRPRSDRDAGRSRRRPSQARRRAAVRRSDSGRAARGRSASTMRCASAGQAMRRQPAEIDAGSHAPAPEVRVRGGQRPQVGEPPGLVAAAGQAQFGEPLPSRRRGGWVSHAGSRAASAQAWKARCRAVTAGSIACAHVRPPRRNWRSRCCSSSAARVLSPEATIRPSLSTCTMVRLDIIEQPLIMRDHHDRPARGRAAGSRRSPPRAARRCRGRCRFRPGWRGGVPASPSGRFRCASSRRRRSRH